MPQRILVLGGGLPAYFEASEDEKRDVFLPAFRAMLAAMVNRVRTEVEGVRLDRYVRFEIRLGRPFWAREEEPG